MSDEANHPIPMIVLSGGPCAGKTSALSRITEWCQEHGFHPLIVPEAATELIATGLDPTSDAFQAHILDDIIHREKLRQKAAKGGQYKNPVIICDRGRMDGLAYMDQTKFATLLGERGLTMVDARDLYTGVIFLDSAACGAERFYTLGNNESRKETVAEARVLNEATKQAWNGTPHLIVIGNEPNASFDDKLHHCTKALARLLGVPEPIECERKFKIHNFASENVPTDAVTVDILQTYLIGNRANVFERVRARGQHNSWLYFHTIKEKAKQPGVVIEHDRLISRQEYENLLIRRDTKANQISKRRHCFVYENQYCELDQFGSNLEGLTLLEFELHTLEQTVTVPSFLGSYDEVTDDPNFSNASLAMQAA